MPVHTVGNVQPCPPQMFGITASPKPGIEGHVFRNPVDPASYMAMLCYKNGSLAREAARDRYATACVVAVTPGVADLSGGLRCAGGTWEGVADALAATKPGNGGAFGFFINQARLLLWAEFAG